MAKLFNGKILFASAIQPTGAQPLDDRTVVKSLTDLYDSETFGLAKYNGMTVSVLDEKQVYMLIDAANSTLENSWIAVGSDESVIKEIQDKIIALETDITNLNKKDGELQTAVDSKVSQTEYNEKINELIQFINDKVSQSDYDAKVEELEGKIDAKVEQTAYDEKVKELSDAIDTKVSQSDYDAKVEELLDAIDTKVSQSDYDAKVEELEGTIETKVNELTESINTKVSQSDYDAKVEELEGKIDTKVDKVSGKSLVLDTEIAKLSTVEENAEKNIIEIIKVNGEAKIVNETDRSVDITIPSAPVQGVASNEKVISLNGDKLSTTLSLQYAPATKDTKALLRILGIDDAVVAELDATAFVKDGILESAKLDGPKDGESGAKYLSLTFNTDAEKEEIRINVTDLIDIYTAGNGLSLTSNEFSIKLDTTSNDYLSVSTAGLAVSQSLLDKITEEDNKVLAAAKKYAEEKSTAAETAANNYTDTVASGLGDRLQIVEIVQHSHTNKDVLDGITTEKVTLWDGANAYTDTEIAKLAEQSLKDAKEYADSLADNYDAKGSAEQSLKDAKEYADSTFVTKEGFNEFEESMETKLNGIEDGAQVNKIETITVNGVSAQITDKNASVEVDSDDINLGVAIVNGEEEVYGATEKVSSVLQGIQDSIVGAINSSLTGVTAGDGISVSEGSENKQTVSVKVSADTNNLLKVKEDGSLFVAMYYDGDDVEE